MYKLASKAKAECRVSTVDSRSRSSRFARESERAVNCGYDRACQAAINNRCLALSKSKEAPLDWLLPWCRSKFFGRSSLRCREQLITSRTFQTSEPCDASSSHRPCLFIVSEKPEPPVEADRYLCISLDSSANRE
jgi:hypothetical protein